MTGTTGLAAAPTAMHSDHFSIVAAFGQGDSTPSTSPSFRLQSGVVDGVPQP